MARTALNVFFTASLLCGLAILTCTYLAHEAAATNAPAIPAAAAPSSSPAAPLSPPPAGTSPRSPPAPPTPAVGLAAVEPIVAVPTEQASEAADTTATPDSTTAVPADADQAASDVLNLNTTAPSLNGTVDDTQDPTADSTPGWQFPWRKFWIYTGFLCAGTGACGLVSGLVLGTLQGFGGCQSCASCDPEAGSASSSGGHSSSYMGSPSDGMAVCGCLFGLLLFAVGVYLVMPMAAASIGYGSGYMVGAVLSTILVLACPCTEGCHTRRAEWKEAWATRTAAARARAGLPPLAAPAAAPAVELPSAKVTSTDAGCKAGGDSDMHSVDLEATVVVPPQQQPGFELH